MPEFKPKEAGRHFFATEYVNAGTDVLTVKTWLGHSDIATIERYAKLRPQTLARVVDMAATERARDRDQNREWLATPAGFEPALSA